MTLRTSLIAIAASLVIGVGHLEASTISFDYTFNPTDVLINNNGDSCTGSTTNNTVSSVDCRSLTFTYALDGYNALTDTLTGGSLSLTFYDDNEPRPDRVTPSGQTPLAERVNISLDGLLTGSSPVLITNGSTSGSPFDSQFDVLAQLQNGILTVLLTLPAGGEGNNDFYFASSRLLAEGTRSDVTVPEPATLTLLGAGLGAAVIRRRRTR